MLIIAPFQPPSPLTLRICDEVAIMPSKRMRNKIAGYLTHLMKRLQRGPVRGF